MGNMEAAVVSLHQALALSPADPLATDLLSTALADAAAQSNIMWPPEADVDRQIDALLTSTVLPADQSLQLESDCEEDMDRSD